MNDDTTTDINSLIKKAKSVSILYAEDEELLRERTALFFKKIFKQVDVAVDGKDALEKYLHNRYDIVITDIKMPNMDGLELIAHIRQLNKEQEIIINSAYTQTEFKNIAEKYSVTNYIRKPIELTEVVKILSDYFNLRAS